MSLRNKFILVLLSIVISIVTLFTYLNLKEDEKTFNIQLENRVDFMKKQILQNAKYTIYYHKREIENDLASMNLSHISSILKQLVQRDEIEGISLVSEDRQMQLFEGRPYHKKTKKETVEVKKDSIVIATPIEISKYWGTLSIVYSLDSLNTEIKKAKRISNDKKIANINNAVGLAVIMFIIFGTFVFFWAKRLMHPILVLTKSAQKMADGSMGEDEELLHLNRNDEVGTLAKTFQKMAHKLENSYKALQELNDSLEEKIKERTKDLEENKEELKVLASIDPMTKLYNRRHFSEVSENIFRHNKKERKSLSLIMLDIDNFKNVNDTYGHAVGDKVIIAIADILREHTRGTDTVCRYGGEEYIILVPDIDMDRCMEIAEAIRVSIENLVIKLEKDKELQVTISIGIAMSDMLVDNNVEIAINKADNALYEAKRGGKNRVMLYSELSMA